MKSWLLSILLLVFIGTIHSQTCESYNRRLFHMLPDTFPEKINCIDKEGKKQGWWINYKIQNNPTDKPSVLAKGDYVEEYWYGQYKNNLKIGTWNKIANVHQVFPEQEDNYFYYTDSTILNSLFWMGGSNTSSIFFNKDSSVIRSKIHSSLNDKGTIFIECTRKENSCVMTYKNVQVKTFSFDKFFLEYEKVFFTVLPNPNKPEGK